MIQSPSNLELLLHCYYSGEPHERLEAPAIQNGINYLLANDMIEIGGKQGIYRTTDKGAAFIEHLMTIRFPEIVWTIRND